MSGVICTNSISSTPTFVSAIADLVALIILGARHERVAETGFRNSDQAKPYGPVSGARRDPHNLRRRKTDHRQVGERTKSSSRISAPVARLAPPAIPRALNPRVLPCAKLPRSDLLRSATDFKRFEAKLT